MKYVDVIFHSQLLNSIKSDIKTSEEVIVRKYGDRIFVNTDKEEYVFYTPNLDYAGFKFKKMFDGRNWKDILFIGDPRPHLRPEEWEPAGKAGDPAPV